MDFLRQLFESWIAFGKENPAIAGSLTLAVPVVFGYLVKSVPRTLWRVFMSQVSTTMTLDNSGYGDNAELQFDRFMAWCGCRATTT